MAGGWWTICLAGVVGLGTGYGAALFTVMIREVRDHTYNWANVYTSVHPWLAFAGIALSPAIGLIIVAWITRTFAPEAAGHGIPEVITAIARQDGVIRPRVSVIKAVSSALCIGTGGSVGREGPIVQVGAALGSSAGQLLRLTPRNVKVLVAAGAAAGISATFNAPLAGVIFSSEIILGSFAIQSMTPVVIASVLADAVQKANRRVWRPAGVFTGQLLISGCAQLPAALYYPRHGRRRRGRQLYQAALLDRGRERTPLAQLVGAGHRARADGRSHWSGIQSPSTPPVGRN
jgi:H+/Cl- antiporter ClcA